MTLKPIILAVAIATLPCTVQAETSFSDAYAAYQSAVENSDAAEQLKQAKLAFELGKAKFGESHINSANLAMNYAKAIELRENFSIRNASGEEFLKPSELRALALGIYEAEYGKEALELIDPLMQLANSYRYPDRNDRKKKAAVDRAVELSEKQGPLFRAKVYTEAGTVLQSVPKYRSESRRHILNAYELYEEHAPVDSIERNLAAFQVAKYYMSDGKYSAAENLLVSVVEQFQKLEHTSNVELVAHAFLVKIYENKGEPEAATQHCLAIGSMTPWSDSQQQEPIYQKLPDYPVAALRRGKSGWVKMSFTVDKMGFVRDPKVIDSKNGNSFEKIALANIKEWRYAPKFENGQPVEASTTVQFDYKAK
ncbi:TonB family protein [Shewanella submarina]|uniref:TonB family protein n=1 Tax=Shewanella submarina TaxID=2016376 RepID=A0ABV7GAA8_9GAMM|nr:energy transducer TonB [Shewanella submarina]MCL1037604.1 TonB family protein [Shewanella submarina]